MAARSHDGYSAFAKTSAGMPSIAAYTQMASYLIDDMTSGDYRDLLGVFSNVNGFSFPYIWCGLSNTTNELQIEVYNGVSTFTNNTGIIPTVGETFHIALRITGNLHELIYSNEDLSVNAVVIGSVNQVSNVVPLEIWYYMDDSPGGRTRIVNGKIWQAALSLAEIRLERQTYTIVRTANIWSAPRMAWYEDYRDNSGNGNNFRHFGFTETVGGFEPTLPLVSFTPLLTNASNGSAAGDVPGTTVATWSHTAEHNVTIYIIALTDGSNGGYIASVTYGGIAATLVDDRQIGSTEWRYTVWRFLYPSAGAANIVVTRGTSGPAAGPISGGAFNCYGGPMEGGIISAQLREDSGSTDATVQGDAAGFDTDSVCIGVGINKVGNTFGSDVGRAMTVSVGTNLWQQGPFIGQPSAGAYRVGLGGASPWTELAWTLGSALPGGSAAWGMYTFVIPSGSAATAGATLQPLLQQSGAILSLTQGVYPIPDAPRPIPGSVIATAVDQHGVVLANCTLKSLTFRIHGVLSGTRAIVFRLWKNSQQTGHTFTFNSATPVDSDGFPFITLTDINLPIYKYGQVFVNSEVTGSGGALPTNSDYCHEIELGTEGESIYGFTSDAVSDPLPSTLGGIGKSPVFTRTIRTWTDAIQASQETLVGCSGTIVEYYLYTAGVGVGDQYDFVLVLNGVVQDGSGGTVDTRVSMINTESATVTPPFPAFYRVQFDLPVVTGDRVYCRATLVSGTPFGATFTCRFVSDTLGSIQIGGVQTGSPDPTALSYATIRGMHNESLGGWSSAPADVGIHVALSDTLELCCGLTVQATNAPGGDAEFNFQVLKNGGAVSGTAEALLIGSATSASGNGSLELDSGDRLSLGATPSGTPAETGVVFFAICGSIGEHEDLGTVVVTKDAGSDTATEFAFGAGGGLTPTTFTLTGGQSRTFINVIPDDGYSLTETEPSGWQLVSVTVSNDSPVDDISVASGETVTVVFVNSNGEPETTTYAIRRLRRAPHLSSEQMWQFFNLLKLDIQAGVGLVTGQGSDPQLMLKWSDDGGFTWSNEHWVSAGKIGQYRRRAIWRRMGRGRDRVYEVTMSDPVLWALLDAEIDATKGTS